MTRPTEQARHLGGRALSSAEIALITDIKRLGAEVGALVARLREHPVAPNDYTGPMQIGEKPALDQRWIALGATHLQQGINPHHERTPCPAIKPLASIPLRFPCRSTP